MRMITGCSPMEHTQPLQQGLSSLHGLSWQSSERTGKKNGSHVGIHEEGESSEDKQSLPYTNGHQPVVCKAGLQHDT